MSELREAHWERVHETRSPPETSWFEPSPENSLRLIEGLRLPRDAAIVDVGGGTSGLAAALLAQGYLDVTVTDISPTALDHAKRALGERADAIEWRVGDVRRHDLGRRFALWHDRAVFHFMVEATDRAAYLANLERSVAAGGHALIATFGPDGPTSCSGLPVRRYGPGDLSRELGAAFALAGSKLVTHTTPAGNHQQFLYATFRRA